MIFFRDYVDSTDLGEKEAVGELLAGIDLDRFIIQADDLDR